MSSNYDSTIALVSASAIYDYLGIPSGGTEESECDASLMAASRRAVEMSGRGVDENGVSRFLSTARTEYYDGDNTNTLMVKSYPISTVATIYVDTDRGYGSDSLLDADDYVWYAMSGTVKTDETLFTGGNKSIKITYTGGYTTVPEDLQQAVKELTAFYYKRNTDKRVGVSSVSVGDKNISYETDVPKASLTVFKRYRDLRNSVG